MESKGSLARGRAMRQRRWLGGVAAVALILAVPAGCGDGGTAPPVQTPTELEAVGAQSFTVTVGANQDVRVRVLDQNRSGIAGQTVTFSATGGTISLTSVVSDAQGQALANWSLGTVAGELSATATVQGLTPVTFAATVNPGPVASIQLTPTDVQFTTLGDTVRMSATPQDAHGNTVTGATVEWSTGDANVVTVDGTGLVTAVAGGSTTVRAAVGTVQQAVDATVTPQPASVTISPTAYSFTSIGAQRQFSAEVRDAGGTLLPGAQVVWTSTNTSVVQVSTAGLATSAGVGTASIIATAGSAADTAAVQVIQVAASVVITPDSTGVSAGETVQLTAQARDSVGTPISGATFTWATSDEAIASVTQQGLVEGVGEGVATIEATHAGLTGTARVSVTVPATALAASTSSYHSCAVADDGRGFCWGLGGWGALGTGTTADQHSPAAVSGTHRYDDVTTARHYSCALRQDGAALCWGFNDDGLLGTGGTAWTLEPVLVTGGHTFQKIEAQLSHTCALRTDGTLWCWGVNAHGQLGADPGGEVCHGTPCRKSPVQVAGGHTFVDFSVGFYHTCGVTGGGETYCWGRNSYGQLGNGSWADASTHVPELVQGSGGYTRLALGGFHSCGVRPDGSSDCWGRDDFGQLGSGRTAADSCTGGLPCSLVPRAVSGGLSFSALSAGFLQTCGVVTGVDAYCWGSNPDNVLGDGTTTTRTVPTRTIGPAFAHISLQNLIIGNAVGCGIDADGALYCWGTNPEGQIGDGTTTNRSQPVRITLPPAEAATSAAADAPTPAVRP
jgi:alpha-tubulin suppressor-like RCC1 family protein